MKKFSLSHNGDVRSIPLWTWVVPLIVSHIGTQVSWALEDNLELAIGFFPMPLAIAMIHWWGPRVLAGFVLNILLCSQFFEMTDIASWLPVVLSNMISISGSWFFFKRLFKGNCWLPDTRNTIAWFLVGVALPLGIGALGQSVFIPGNPELLTKLFLWDFWDRWTLHIFGTLAIASPLLLLFSPLLEQRGWTLTRGATFPLWIPEGRQRSIAVGELFFIFGGAFILSILMPFERYWYLFCFFSLWSALRYGIGAATVTNTVIVTLAVASPLLSNGLTITSWAPHSAAVQVHPGMTLLYFVSLVTGRTYTDIRSEIAERIAAETALRKEKAFTDEALDAQKDVFLVFEPTSGRPIRWNKAFREASGLSDDEIRSTRIPDDWISPEQVQFAASKVNALMTLGHGTVELSFMSRTGQRIPTEYVATMMTSDVIRENYVIAIGRDISDRKKMEEERKELEMQLRQAQKMDAIGTLAAGLANDFNNILSTIIGFSELIYDELENKPLLKSHMEHVLTAGDRAKALVRQILAFSRQNEGSRTVFSPASVVRETVKLLHSSLPDNISLVEEVSDDAGTIHTDPTQYHQVLMNLCTNACHSMENKGGTLTIILKHQTFSRSQNLADSVIPPGEFVQLTVKDTGTGIEPAIREKIFEPYFTTKSIGRGTGLGLAIVHGIVNNSGGFIRVESNVDEGTAFHIFLPASTDMDRFTPLPPDASLIGNEHILYVDDEMDIISVSERILGKSGYRVTAKNSSVDALEEFQKNPQQFDLVITDQSMPHMSGLELAREISTIRTGMPIILYTGYSTDVTEANLASYGIYKVLIKPLRMNELISAVRETIDKSRQRSGSV